MESRGKIIRDYYKKLEHSIIRNKRKVVNSSVLWTLILMKEKDRKLIIDESSINPVDFDASEVEALIDDGMISVISSDSQRDMILTAKGIWEAEKLMYGFIEKDLLELIEGKYFSFSTTTKPLDDKDKLALLALLGARCFSKETAMDLKNEDFLDGWTTVMENCFNFLNEHGFFKKRYSDVSKVLEKKAASHEVESLMRHRNDLPLKSNNIFRNPGNYKYWIEIIQDEKISNSKLTKVLSLIFSDKSIVHLTSDLQKLLETIAHENSKFVRKNFIYLDAKSDLQIREAVTAFCIKS